MSTPSPYTATYERPVGARLIVRLDNGDEWEAKPDDLARFRLVDPYTVYARFERWAVEALGLARDKDITETVANPLRYAVECALNYDHMPDAEVALELRAQQALVSHHNGFPFPGTVTAEDIVAAGWPLSATQSREET